MATGTFPDAAAAAAPLHTAATPPESPSGSVRRLNLNLEASHLSPSDSVTDTTATTVSDPGAPRNTTPPNSQGMPQKSLASRLIPGAGTPRDASGSGVGSGPASPNSARSPHASSAAAQRANGPSSTGAEHTAHGGSGSPVTPVQQQLEMARTLESEAEKKVSLWRRSTRRQAPLGLVADKADFEKTRSLFAYIVDCINQTFDSVVLMRLLTELLFSLGKYTEALAALDTYVSYQKLQLLRIESGGESTFPDTPIGVARIFSLALANLVSTELTATGTYTDVDRVTDLVTKLTEILPKGSDSAVGLAHGVLAQAYMFQSARVVGNDYYSNRLAKAAGHFDIAFSLWKGDSATAYAYGLFLVQTKGPAEAFPHVRAAAAKDPENTPLCHLLILLLTAQEEYEYAQQVAEGVLDSFSDSASTAGLSGYYKKHLLEIKKTHVAIIEARQGIAAALDSLPSTLNLLGQLYPIVGEVQAAEQIRKANGSVSGDPKLANKLPHASEGSRVSRRDTRRENKEGKSRRPRLFGGRKSSSGSASGTSPAWLPAHSTASSISDTSTLDNTAVPEQNLSLDLSTRQQLTALWVWVAQMYIRADLSLEAEQALREATSVQGLTPEIQAVSGLILSQDHPKKAWAKLQRALAMDALNLGAILGQAQLLERLGRVEYAVVNTTKPSPLFADAKVELQAYTDTLGLLEELTTRNPGRYTPEAWYLSGVLYEALGDKESAREALWKSVELEEKSGLRSY